MLLSFLFKLLKKHIHFLRKKQKPQINKGKHLANFKVYFNILKLTCILENTQIVTAKQDLNKHSTNRHINMEWGNLMEFSPFNQK